MIYLMHSLVIGDGILMLKGFKYRVEELYDFAHPNYH